MKRINKRRSPYPKRAAKIILLPITTQQATIKLAGAMAMWANVAAKIEVRKEL